MENKLKLTKDDMDISKDLHFVDNLFEYFDMDIEVAPEARSFVLDLAYTMSQNKLIEARRFANLVKKDVIDVKDFEITDMGSTDDFELGTFQLAKPIVQHLTNPSDTTSLLLPPWRNCQVGANAELKQLVAEEHNSTDNAPTFNKTGLNNH